MRGFTGLRRDWRRAVGLLVGLVLLVAGRAAAEISAVEGGIQFTYVNDGATQVFWAGEFNGWSTTANPFTKEGDKWTLTLPLPAGEHMYKFVVDGAWVADPDNPETKGDYGNSLVRVGADGKLQVRATAAAVASSLNPKIVLNGRFISLFQSMTDKTQGDRLELRRPDFDLDLDYKVKMSEMLDGRILTNIRSERDNVPFWQTHLNFDRGHLRLHSDRISVYAFDEDVVPTWEDPLHLVGNVGIYRHDYGYDQQGMQAEKTVAGFDIRLLYADSFRNPGPSRPASLPQSVSDLVQWELRRGQKTVAGYGFTDGDNNKDALAFRAQRALGKAWRLGLSTRVDRGQNPGLAGVAHISGDSGDVAVRSVMGSTLERWNGVGGDLAWTRGAWNLQGEYLWGRNSLDFLGDATGVVTRYTDLDTTVTPIHHKDIGSEPIATDNRVYLGARGPWKGFDFDLSLEYHGTDVTPLGNDSALALDNRLTTWAMAATRGWTLSHERKLNARLGLTLYDFNYDAGTPWRNQFWFDRRNFWLEAGEHQVSFDRIVMLGGNDVVSWKPSVSIDLASQPNVNFRWAGTFNGVSLGKRPKYAESLFQLTWQATARTRLYSDTRWVKYDDPVLNLDDGYVSTFLELAYAFTPGISFALSWGVDPYVIDDQVNEYANIGRDQFLFARSVTGAQAASDFFSLGSLLPRAEKALQDERRVQLEAQVRF